MDQQTVPLLTTERLTLRQLQSSDDKAIFTLRNNGQVNAFIQRPLLNNRNEAQYFITVIDEGINNKEWLYWALILKSNQQLIGTICLWHFSKGNTVAEIGYEMHPDYQGKGLMSEAIQTIIRYGFHILHLKRIEAYTQPANAMSIKLLEKNGFLLVSVSNQPSTSREIRFILDKPEF
jgi:ribosomal-protein-alanine N-acetyltransferase